MREYQKRVNKLIQSLVSDILDGKLTNKKAINKALAKLSKDIGVPLNELKVRLADEAKKSATKSAHAVVKELMANNQDAVIKSMTAEDISKMVDVLFQSTQPFRRMNKDGKTISYAIKIEDWFDYLGDDMVKKVRQGILGAYIDGSHPAEVARNVLLNAGYANRGNKALKQKLKTLAFTLIHKANELANLQTFIDNEKYISWVHYVSIDDERRDTVCEEADRESVDKKLKPTEYARQDMAVPSLHPNCRCTLYAMTGDVALKPKPLQKPKEIIKKKPIKKIVTPPKIVPIEKPIEKEDDGFDFMSSLNDKGTVEEAKTPPNTKVFDDISSKVQKKITDLEAKKYKSNDKQVSYNANATQLTGKTGGSISHINEARKTRMLNQYANELRLSEELKDLVKHRNIDDLSTSLVEKYFDMISKQTKLANDDFAQDFLDYIGMSESIVSNMVKNSRTKKGKAFFEELLKRIRG